MRFHFSVEELWQVFIFNVVSVWSPVIIDDASASLLHQLDSHGIPCLYGNLTKYTCARQVVIFCHFLLYDVCIVGCCIRGGVCASSVYLSNMVMSNANGLPLAQGRRVVHLSVCRLSALN